MIPSLLLSPFLGSFVDRFGLRMLLVGSLWGAAALALLSCCCTLPQFYLVFFLGGFVFSPTSSYLASLLLNSWFKKHQALACSIVYGRHPGSAAFCGAYWFPPLVQRFSYRAGYAFCSGLWLALMLLCTFLCKGLPQDVGVLPLRWSGFSF